MNLSTEVAKRLLQIKAIKLSPQNLFTWASGIKSPIYCDNRIVLSYPSIRSFIIKALAKESEQFGSFDKIAGVATAGIAHGALLANELDLPFIYIRSKAKGHGRKNSIEGEIKKGEKILVIEDLISTGGSCLKAVEELRAVDCNVVGVMAIFSYGFEDAKIAFQQANCKFTTLSNYDALLKEALQQNYIKDKDLITLQDWRRNPKELI